MKTLLVIGGSGFFGKSILDAFSRKLLNSWQVGKVIVMSRHVESLLDEAPSLVGENVELFSADITKTDFLPAADYVIHAAASTDLKDYLSRPEDERKNIQSGTYNYCDLAKKFHKNSKILYISSGAVYGKQPEKLDRLEESFVSESLDGMDLGKSDYAFAKRDSEEAILKLGFDGMSVSIARCFSFVGPWLPRDQHFAIGNFIGNILKKTPIEVKANHHVYRSYMYADDLVEWMMTIIDHASTQCPIYNVGSDQEVLLGDLAKNLAISYGGIAHVNKIKSDKIDRYVPSIEKANGALGLGLKYDLDAAIKETLQNICSKKII
jgi:nucleoside-diphosphate-sugar epimerase